MTPPTPTPDLEEAGALHRAGRLQDASAAYQRILADHPDTTDALHGLGLIALDLNQPTRALPLLTRCVAVAPDHRLYRTSLGLALLRTGEHEQAAAHLLEAANRSPRDVEPRLLLARALGNLGRWGQARDVLTATVEAFPKRADVWNAKGNAERMLGKHDAAENSFRRALALAPDDADTLNNLGVVLRSREQVEEAIGFYRQALAHAPDRAVIHANLGNALTHLGRTALAETHLRRAAELDPESAEARYNLAVFLTRGERAADAVPHFRAALAADPKNASAWTNMGVALLDTGDTEGAEDSYRRAIALQPGNTEAHYNLAWVLLLTGQWAEGWKEYEWRWALDHFSSRKRIFDQPLWDGQPHAGTVLLHAEQGLGDAIQFVRYAALVKKFCARVIVECPPSLVRLFRHVAGADQVIAAGSALPAFDAHAPFMSLPRLFGTTPTDAPLTSPYISAPDEAPAHLRLPNNGKRRIGVVWAGSPDNKIDRRRTIPAQWLADIAATVDADFISLQVGPRADEASAFPPDKLVFSCEGRVADFADTATIVNQLDLVLGVDTAVMHLAGAMGKPVWLLIPFMPDYRWLLGRDDTPWYSSMRLFRQEKSGDWPGVMTAVAAALTNWQPESP
jgi:tetratricopeptide (TPR) repeat protein